MATRIETATKAGLTDAMGAKLKSRLAHDMGIAIDDARVVDVYTVDKDLPKAELERLRVELFADPITQDSALKRLSLECDFAIEVGFLPGVTDNVGHSSREAVEDLLKVKFSEDEGVYSSRMYLLKGKLAAADLKRVVDSLYNPLIERVRVMNREEYRRDGGAAVVPKVVLPPNPGVSDVDLEIDDVELAKIGREGIADKDAKGAVTRRGPLALDLKSLYAIRDYFREEGRKPTDVELESLAQTWSEHCKHTIFAAELDDIKDGLYKACIQAPTRKIRSDKGDDDFCVSVFTDNSGVIRFTDDYNVCFKVETHNSPSALDPYGGAITGIVGVNRDPLGTGMGAKLAVNIYGFCFGDPYFAGKLPNRRSGGRDPILHPKVIFEGVRRGVEHGGNKSGVPTSWGFIRFDRRYMGKPLVFVGTLGIMPAMLNGQPSHLKGAGPGDLIVMAGGRVGKDGIHGATFSSESLNENSPAAAVQIGDPITQKKLGDAQHEAAELGLYTSVTDNGAGGLSCSVGEMARECGGAKVDLEKIPLKYPGLPPNEVWISESQERMTYAVSPDKIKDFLDLMRRRGVEASVIGEFTDSGRCVVNWNGKKVMDVGLDFLHNGLPRKELKSEWSLANIADPKLDEPSDIGATILEMLARLNVCSKEYVVRQYDHEVQGGSVVKPLAGVGQDVHTDAVVVKPLLSSKKGVSITTALFPSYGDIDPYWMGAAAIETSIRNLVAVGSDPDRIAILDNFCWCSSDEPFRLGQLRRAALACKDFSVAFGAPFISGKDSMFNDFKGFDEKDAPVKISIPPTLLISAIGVVDDVLNAQTPDFKAAGDFIYLIGATKNELGASEYYAMRGEKDTGEPYGGSSVPTVDAKSAMASYRSLHKAITGGLVSATATVTVGGLAVALARMAMAGRLGAAVDLSAVPVEGKLRADAILFSETVGRVVVSVRQKSAGRFESLFAGQPFAKIGEVTDGGDLDLRGPVKAKISINDMLASYKKTLDWR